MGTTSSYIWQILLIISIIAISYTVILDFVSICIKMTKLLSFIATETSAL